MLTITVKTPDISCGHCVHTIESEVGELAGIQQVQAAEDSKLVTITYDAPATREQIEALLAEIGYPAQAA